MSDKSLRVGDAAPDFTLSDQEGTAVSLRELLASGCLVLCCVLLPQAFWCAEDARTLRGTRHLRDRFTGSYPPHLQLAASDAGTRRGGASLVRSPRDKCVFRAS
jgi:hypothetical protein